MANPWAGEVALVIGGERHVMRLTLGALAELEAALEQGSLVDLVARFEEGAFSSRDVLALIVAGLRGRRRNCWRGPLPCPRRVDEGPVRLACADAGGDPGPWPATGGVLGADAGGVTPDAWRAGGRAPDGAGRAGGAAARLSR